MRVEYPGAIYHVMDRGDRREDIFVNEVDRQDLLRTLAEACQKTDWQVHAARVQIGTSKGAQAVLFRRGHGTHNANPVKSPGGQLEFKSTV